MSSAMRPPQQKRSQTAESLSKLRQAEQKLLSSLTHASAATNTLSSANHLHCHALTTHAQSYLSDLYTAQMLVRHIIQTTVADRPYENITLRRLLEADLSVQRSTHVHRALLNVLHVMGETPDAPQQAVISSAASPPYMPSPTASTPGWGMAIAPSPPGGGPIMVAVPSPADAGAPSMASHVPLNGGVAEDEAMHEA